MRIDVERRKPDDLFGAVSRAVDNHRSECDDYMVASETIQCRARNDGEITGRSK